MESVIIERYIYDETFEEMTFERGAVSSSGDETSISSMLKREDFAESMLCYASYYS